MLVLHSPQEALLFVQQDTVAVAVPLQVRGLRRHHLGVGVASAHFSASQREAVQHPSLQQARPQWTHP